WVGQFQPEPSLVIEGLADVLFEPLESARRPQRRLAMLGALRQARADREQVRGDAQQPAAGISNEGDDLVEIRASVENVYLVQHDDDLLAPALNDLKETALGFGERSIGRGHKQNEIRTRNE